MDQLLDEQTLSEQRLERNAEPFRRRCAIGEERDIERRIVGQQGVQFHIMSGGRARDVEGGFHGGLILHGKAPAEGNVKDKPEIQINCIEDRQICKAVDRLFVSFFDRLDKGNNLVDLLLIQDATRLPEEE